MDGFVAVVASLAVFFAGVTATNAIAGQQDRIRPRHKTQWWMFTVAMLGAATNALLGMPWFELTLALRISCVLVGLLGILAFLFTGVPEIRHLNLRMAQGR